VALVIAASIVRGSAGCCRGFFQSSALRCRDRQILALAGDIRILRRQSTCKCVIAQNFIDNAAAPDLL
jgi:hypothetical protein